MSKTKFNIILTVIIVVWVVGVYCNSLNNAFQFDDELVIVHNQSIKSVFGKNDGAGTFRPLLYFTLAMNYYFSGLDVYSYHITNLMIHIAVSILVFIVINKIVVRLQSYKDIKESGAKLNLLPFFAALLFAIHPINSQTVNYISARSSSLCVMFYIAALLLFIKYKECALSKSILYFMGSFLSFILALCSREMAIIFPMLVLFYDFVFYRTNENINCEPNEEKTISSLIGKYRLYHIPYWLVLIAGVIKVGVPKLVVPFTTNLIMACKSYLYYLELLFLPVKLSIVHFFPVTGSFGSSYAIFAMIVMLVLIAGMAFMFKRGKIVSFCIFLYFIALLPTSSVVLANPGAVTTMIGEHRIYGSAIGFCTIVVLLIIYMSQICGLTIKTKKDVTTTNSKILGLSITRLNIIQCVLIVPLLILCSYLTVKRNLDWRDSITLWSAAAEKHPESFKAYYNLGVSYTQKQLWNTSIFSYIKALKINNNDPETHNNLGIAYKETGQLDRAITEFNKAINLNNNYVDAHFNLAETYRNRGLVEKAIHEYVISLQLKPDNAIACYNLGVFYMELRGVDDALFMFNKVLEILNINSFENLEMRGQQYSYINEKIQENMLTLKIESLNNLGNLFIKKGEIDQAIKSYNAAITFDNNRVIIHNNLGLAYYRKGQMDKAEEAFKTALSINPEFPDAHNFLGVIYNGNGLFEEAFLEFTAAVNLKPDYYVAHKNLGLIYINYKKDVKNGSFHLKETLRLAPNQKQASDINSILESLK